MDGIYCNSSKKDAHVEFYETLPFSIIIAIIGFIACYIIKEICIHWYSYRNIGFVYSKYWRSNVNNAIMYIKQIFYIDRPTMISYLQLITYHLLYVRKYFDDIHNCSNNVSLLTLSQHSNVISIFLLNESYIEYRTSENNWTLVMDKLLTNAVIRRAFWNLCIRKWYV